MTTEVKKTLSCREGGKHDAKLGANSVTGWSKVCKSRTGPNSTSQKRHAARKANKK
jgi:hypothetical protein